MIEIKSLLIIENRDKTFEFREISNTYFDQKESGKFDISVGNAYLELIPKTITVINNG